VPGTFAFWKHTLAREAEIARPAVNASTGTPPSFVPVHAISRPPAPTERPAAGAIRAGALEIVLDGRRRVRVRGPVDVQWLGQVLRTVESLGC
jgi:hypothetical protein